MRSSRTLTSSSTSGHIIVFTDTGMPELEARTLVRLDDLHYQSFRKGEEGRVFRFAEDFFIHLLPAYIRMKELLKAQQFHHKAMLGAIDDELGTVDRLIEEARREDR
jgi:hypothetical protein